MDKQTDLQSSIDLLLTAYNQGVKSINVQFQDGELSPQTWKASQGAWLARYCMTSRMLDERPITGEQITGIQGWILQQGTFLDGMISLKDVEPDVWQDIAYLRLTVAFKTFAEYRRRLWDAAQRLFSGGGDANFIATFARSIDVQITKAWAEGAEAIGVAPDEMTDRDRKVLDKIIKSEDSFIVRIAGDIQDAKAKGMEQDQFERQFGARVDVWATRYPDVVNQAILYFGKKERLIWQLGKSEESCDICPQLNNIVAFGQEWSTVGLHPQRPPNAGLSKDRGGCGGWQCHCTCEPTKKRRTTNALKKLMAIAGKA